MIQQEEIDMVYAFIENGMKSIQFSIYGVNYFITEREEYEKIKSSLTQDDTLLIEKGSLVGNSVNQLITEVLKLRDMGIHFTLLDNPFLSDCNSNIIKVLEYLDQIKKEGTVKYGRPKTESSVKFDKLYKMYLAGETKKAIENSGLSRATFYRRLEQYEKENKIERRRNSSALEYGRLLGDKSKNLLNV